MTQRSSNLLLTRRLALACAVGLATAVPALAQNALGDGRALDRNSRLGSGGVNGITRTGSAELRFRNAIVTGNAPGGMSFRGDVGYTAPMDFRGELGSDDLFTFTRDSYFSGLAASPVGQRYRGVDALQFQMQVSTQGVGSGRQPGFEPTLSRGISQAAADSERAAPDTGSLSRLYEPLLTRPGALRSTAEFITGDALAPTLLGSGESASGDPLYAMASPLRSISMQPDLAPERAPSPNLLSRPVEGEEVDGEKIDGAAPGRADSNRVVQEEILDAFREARQRERDLVAEQLQAGEEGAESQDGDQQPDMLNQDLQRLREQLNNPNANEDDVRRLTRDVLPDRAARVDRLITPVQDRNVYAEHMKAGQDLLAEDRWFEAEERFTSALAMRPNDSIAAVGRIHAQIGGALYRSASENLKSLFRNNPEMLAVQFDASLLPRGERLDAIRVSLRDRARGESEFSRGAALLLAYLGYQYDNERDIVLGFEEVDRITAALGDQPDPVYDAARAAWMPDEAE